MKMNIKFLSKLSTILWIVLFVTISGLTETISGQEATIDSLKNELQKTKNSIDRIEIFLELSRKYCYTNSQKSFDFATQAYQLAKKSGNKKLTAQALKCQMVYYYYQKQYDIAVEKADRCLKITNEINDSACTADVYNILGNLKHNNSKQDAGNAYYRKALHIYNQLNDYNGMATVNSNIGFMYLRITEYDSALHYFKKALKYDRKSNNLDGKAITLNNIAEIYAKKGDYKQGFKYYKQALKLFKQTGYQKAIGQVLNNIGTLYFEQDEFNQAIAYFKKSIKVKREANDDVGLANSILNIAKCNYELQKYHQCKQYIDSAETIYKQHEYQEGLAGCSLLHGKRFYDTKDYSQALEYLNLAIKYSQELKNNLIAGEAYYFAGRVMLAQEHPEQAIVNFEKCLELYAESGIITTTIDVYKGLYEAWKQLKKYDKALKYHELYAATHDSIFNLKKDRQLKELLTQFETLEKEKKLTTLNKEIEEQQHAMNRQRLIIVFSAIILALTIVAAVLGFAKYNTQKRSGKELKAKNDLIENQKIEIITQNKHLSKQAVKLKELDKMKSQFFANISHEFRTPLTLILGPLDSLARKLQKKELREEIQMIKRNAVRLLSLINQLLELSKIEQKQAAVNYAMGDLTEWIRTIVANFGSLASDKKIALQFHDAGEKLKCLFDRDKIEKIVVNLISNAIKFTPEGGEVTVNLNKKSSDSYQIRITDTGTGIPPEKRHKIFDRFYTTPANEQYGEATGTGIGLSLVKELTEILGGSVAVNSKGKNKGSEFVVTLPYLLQANAKDVGIQSSKTISYDTDIKNYDLPETKTQPQKPQISHAANRQLILIVEDNPDMSRYIKQNLENGFDIELAENGKQGFNKALESNPVLIVTDVMMPVMDGYELTTKLKKDNRTCHIPVIMLTAKVSVESRLKGLKKLADDYITKPFHIEELSIRINNLIQLRVRLIEKFSRTIDVKPSDVAENSIDEQFLQKALRFVEENIDNPEISVEQFCIYMAVSRTNLHRKLKALTGKSATEFIRSIRLKRAASLLQQKSGTVSDVAYSVGFNNLSYFSRCFKEEIGKLPSEI